MSTQIAKLEPKQESLDVILVDIQSTQKMCNALMNTPHYKKLGAEGIFAIVQKARTLNVNPLDALNGGLYCVNGKVEMSAQMMIQLIRQSGHSVTKDKRSDDTICILHGKRKDNGDTWTESFSIQDAKRAGIYKNVWEKFPRNMLFARALSNLARQLFADIIKGCYVEGEISQAVPLQEKVDTLVDKETGELKSDAEVVKIEYQKITLEQFNDINDLIGEDTEYRNSVLRFIKKQVGADKLEDMPASIYDKVYARAKKNAEDKQGISVQAINVLPENGNILTANGNEEGAAW
jgi:hypothetical protein